MPSEPVSDGIFYFGVRFLFLSVFSLPSPFSEPPPTPAEKLLVLLLILLLVLLHLNKEAIRLKSDKENKMPSESVSVP